MLKPTYRSIYSWRASQVSSWRRELAHTWMEYSRAGLNLGPKHLSFECSKRPRQRTHSRWAFRSEQTVEVFRRGERATLKECVTFSLRLFFFFLRSSEERGGEGLGWVYHWDMTFLILSFWTHQDSDRKTCEEGGGILEGCPEMLTLARGVEKHPWGAFWTGSGRFSDLSHY